MPATTPVSARSRPERAATIVERPAEAFRITPTISTSNRSTAYPLRTVRPYPFMPSRTSETGRIPAAFAGAPRRARARAANAT